MRIAYTPFFARQLNKLDDALQHEAIEKITRLADKRNYSALKVHKLHGQLADRYSFSVNFKYRIAFQYLSKTEVVLLAIGDHAVYQ